MLLHSLSMTRAAWALSASGNSDNRAANATSFRLGPSGLALESSAGIETLKLTVKQLKPRIEHFRARTPAALVPWCLLARLSFTDCGTQGQSRTMEVCACLSLHQHDPLFGVLGALAIFRTCVLQQLSRAGQLEVHAALMLGVLPSRGNCALGWPHIEAKGSRDVSATGSHRSMMSLLL